MGQRCKKSLRRYLFVFYMIQLQFFLKRERFIISATENKSFRVDNVKFFIFGSMYLCKKTFGRQVAFLGQTGKSWSVIIQNVNGKIRANLIVFVFTNEYNNLMSARQIVQSFRSLVEKYDKWMN